MFSQTYPSLPEKIPTSEKESDTGLTEEVLQNLNPRFPLRSYQQLAVQRLLWAEEFHDDRQLLFQMATGSGKTLVMAAAVLAMHRKGFRHFIFFVNSTAVIEKTRDNFLNKNSSKYLFSKNLNSGGAAFNIRETETFSAPSPQDKDIQIMFSTVQALHNKLLNPRENSITEADLTRFPLVLLSDEAHHINSETKKLNAKEKKVTLTWEESVRRIFEARPDNLLLEFTATADLKNPKIAEKYRNKLLIDYSLSEFRREGFSKEIRVLEADLPPFERALQALILSEYRRFVFADAGIFVKPVILMKSKTIADSRDFASYFAERLSKLDAGDLEKLPFEESDTLKKALVFFEEKGGHLTSLSEMLRRSFAPEHCLSSDSKNDTEEKQLLLNSLEEKKNPYRVIFAVDKLNEGWDVLNLFDIVRLYDSKSSASGVSKTTMAEAQLIGRGARYMPFQTPEFSDLYRRKFDEQPGHPLQIGEELFYHAAYHPAYIRELKRAMHSIGLRSGNEVSFEIKYKKDFLDSEFYRTGSIEFPVYAANERQTLKGLGEIKRPLKVSLFSGFTQERSLTKNELALESEKGFHNILLSDFNEALLLKASDRLPFYRFSKLKTIFPELRSLKEFLHSDNYAGGLYVKVIGLSKGKPQELNPHLQLSICTQALNYLSEQIIRLRRKKNIVPAQKRVSELCTNGHITRKANSKLLKHSVTDKRFPAEFFFFTKREFKLLNEISKTDYRYVFHKKMLRYKSLEKDFTFLAVGIDGQISLFHQ